MADGGRAKIAASPESATAQNGNLALSNSTGALNTDANALLPPAEAAGSQAEAGTNQTPVTQPNVTAIVPATAPAVNAIPSVTIPPINTPSATITATEPVPPILNTQSALVSAAASAQANLGGGAARLGFTFSGQSWVEVTDKSGATILSRKFNAGDSEEITGRGPFTIVVGNATVTRMAYNGREFDLTPHRRANGTVARVNLK
jgi:cytoskeleton protein RodZ